MLDNFGMGEFLMLALFALLFFGPERLPQIGARLGRWLSQLTQASKTFMNQWTEEAAAIQDAVNEVRGIRDEIRAAQAEISSSLDVARQDITETISEARGTVREAAVTPQGILAASASAEDAPVDTSAPPRLATPEETEHATSPASTRSGDEGEALSKTQDVLDDLLTKRGLSAPDAEPGDNGAESDEDSPPADDEYQRNLRAIQEIMDRDARRAEQKKARQAEPALEPDTEEQATASVAEPGEELAQEGQGEEDVEEQVQESAFDKTQRILDGLLGPAVAAETAGSDERSEAGPEPASEGGTPAVAASVPTVPAEEAWDEGASAEEVSAVEAPVDAVPAVEASDEGATAEQVPASADDALAEPGQGADEAVPSDGDQQAPSPDRGVSPSEFAELSEQVTQLERQLEALQNELQALRMARSPAQDGPEAVSMENAA